MAGTDVGQRTCDYRRQIPVPHDCLPEAIECQPDLSCVNGPNDRQRILDVKHGINAMSCKFRVVY